jgi:hypothetical protein
MNVKSKNNKDIEQDMELNAMATVYNALRPLDGEAQKRVLEYVLNRLALKNQISSPVDMPGKLRLQNDQSIEYPDERPIHSSTADEHSGNEQSIEGLEGVSPIAQKWMRRNGFSESQLSLLFSIGGDEIDLVAQSVPGKTTKQKFRNILLLQGAASYLSGGAPRIDYNKLKQALGHYGADPEKNMWAYLKSLSAEVSGTTASGFVLTARGMNASTELIKEIVGKK